MIVYPTNDNKQQQQQQQQHNKQQHNNNTIQTALIGIANWADHRALVTLPASLTTLEICYYTTFAEYGGSFDDIYASLQTVYENLPELQHLSFTQAGPMDNTISAVRLLLLSISFTLIRMLRSAALCHIGYTMHMILIIHLTGNH